MEALLQHNSSEQDRAHRVERREHGDHADEAFPHGEEVEDVGEGLVSVISVLTALYPVSTVVLARVVLKERFHRVQVAGMALALPAAVLMAV